MNLTAGFVVFNLQGIVFRVEVPWSLDADFDREALIQLHEYAETLAPGCQVNACVYEWDGTGRVLRGWGLQAWRNRVAWKMQSYPPFVQVAPPTA